MNDFQLNGEKLLSATYRFSTTVQDENLSLNKQYIREVSVKQLNFRNEETKFQLLCKKFSFMDPHITPLIRKTAYVFDVLMVTVSSNGRIKAIENEKEIQGKWERLKIELQKDHAGYVFENYLHSVDLTVHNKAKLIAFLESDKMYGIFFKSLWLYDSIDQINQYTVSRPKNILGITKKTNDKLQSEQYIYQQDYLHEGIKIDNHIQYEILCLGLKIY